MEIPEIGIKQINVPEIYIPEIYRPDPVLPVITNLEIDVVGCTYQHRDCLLYTSPSPRDLSTSRMPSSA